MAAVGYDPEVTRVGESAAVAIESCAVCGGREARPEFRIPSLRLDIVLCAGCGLGSLHPMPDPDLVESFYPAAYYGSGGHKFSAPIERLVAGAAGLRARSVARGLPAGARILDVGCGRGLLLGRLAARGFEVHGVDVSEEAVRGVDPRVEVRLAWDLAEADYPAGYFDRVLLWHVLEHLASPRRALEEIHRVLAPGGRLLVAVPNLASWQAVWAGPAWFHLDPPRHLHHFPLPALTQLLGRCGFESLAVRHFSLRQNPFGWVQSLLNRWHWLPRCGLYSLLQGDRSTGMSVPQQVVSLVAFVAGMPAAVALSALAALCRTGATVSVEARKLDS